MQLIPHRVHSIFHSGLNTRSEMKFPFGIMYTWIEISLLNETRNEIDVHHGRNKDCLENRKFYLYI